MNFNPDANFNSRFYSHVCLGLKSKIKIETTDAPKYQHKPNLVEKAGNGILWVLNSVPKSVKWIGKQLQDPRVATVLITITALFLTTLAFYPVLVTAKLTAAFKVVRLLLARIPLWSVKLAGYIATCSLITGCGARAAGRFANADLMKAFYGLPKDHPGNPANMTISEIRKALARRENHPKSVVYA